MFTSQVVISQLHEAVERARHGRHHPTCDCGLFRHGDGTYCSAEEWRWSRIIDFKPAKLWRAYITHKSQPQRIELGYFKTKEEAIAARKAAEEKYFGECA